MNPHEPFIRRTNRLAIEAAKKGNHPFGAVLAHEGEVIAEAENTVNTDRDPTRHAELNLVVKVNRVHPPDFLKESTLYASTAPCLMCAANIWRTGIKKVVYGVTYETFSSLVPEDHKYVSIEEVYRLLDTPLHAIGGILEEECLKAYEYWPED
ncbi:MAG: nucleoside deaminase [Candidatus Bathyarchaeia archaeon]